MENVRIGRVIYLPGATKEDTPPRIFTDFCEDLPEGEDDLYKQLPALNDFKDMDFWPNPDEVAEVLLGTPGFIVEAEYASEGHWGSYYLKWIYAPNEPEILKRSYEWARTVGVK